LGYGWCIERGLKEKMTTDLKTWPAWHTIHQPFELNWWKRALAEGHSCDDKAFLDAWLPVKEWIEPLGHVIDIGCGPRPPFAPCTVIDPLADEYRKITPPEWWHRVVVHSSAAETFIPSLAGSGDTVICWNALDHAVGWKDILLNMRFYCKRDAQVAIALDFWDPFDGHPGCPRGEFDAEIAKHFVEVKRKEPFGRHLALLLKARK
jgi:hypothetical protein